MNTENFHAISHRHPTALANELFSESADLEQRLHFTQETIRNTLVKLGYLRRPDHLRWALNRNVTLRPIGIYNSDRTVSNLSGTHHPKDLTEDIRTGKTEINENYYLRFALISGPNIGQASIQLKYLRNDPIAIAQMVRRECYANEQRERDLDRTMLTREKDQLTREHVNIQKAFDRQIAQLDKKLVRAHKPLQVKQK